MKVLYVEWVDACTGSSWEKIDDVTGIHKCKSIGFLIKETKEEIILAASLAGDECNSSIAIPRAWIKNKKLVKL